MTLRRVIVPLALVVVVLGTPLAFAGQADDEWARVENRLRNVALTDKQKAELDALKSEFLKKRQEILEHAKEAKWELDYIFSEEPFGKEEAAEEQEELRAMREQWRNERQSVGAKIWAMLTPEQRAKLGPSVKRAQNLFPMGRYENQWARVENRLKNVVLTDTQKTELNKLRLEFLNKQRELMGQLKGVEWELDYIFSEEPFSKEDVQQELTKLGAIRNQFQKIRRETGAKIWSLLTPEQRNQLGPAVKKAQNLFPRATERERQRTGAGIGR